ncbi:MAG: LPP20 family lipoprotein [Bacteroidales bacterium]|nr:LPP20 family lipoprotein [Bacteroidales bacterium]
MLAIGKTTLMGLLLLCATVSFAQNKVDRATKRARRLEVRESRKIWKDIKADRDTYLWGEGSGSSIEAADHNALSAITSQIAVSVSSEFDMTEEETATIWGVDSKSVVLSKVSTYSTATLTNASRIILSYEPSALVGRYIDKQEISRMFAERLVKVKNYAEYGQRSLEKNKIDDALRYYYWSLMLLQSVPHGASSQFRTHEGENVTLATWLPMQIDEILDGIKVSFLKKRGSDAVLSFTYLGNPVSSLGYTFFDGRSWSNIYNVKDGIGIVELPTDIEITKVQLCFEYAYAGLAGGDADVSAVLSTGAKRQFRGAWCNVVLRNFPKPKTPTE